jgi:hypothetical protein
MSIAKFLRDEIGIRSVDVDALEKLAGKRIGGSVGFLPDLEGARRAFEPWMPVHFLPIGDFSGSFLGAWLRPKDVLAGRLVTARATREEMIGTGSLGHLVYAQLLSLEASYPDPSSKYLRGPSEVAKAAFGDGFYRPGAHGALDDGVVERLATSVKGGSADAWRLLVRPSVDPTRENLRKALGTDPDCLYFRAMAAREAASAGRSEEAAKEAAAALRCRFESAYSEGLDEFLDFARGLAKDRPAAFTADDCALALAMGDVKKHGALTKEVGDRGNLSALEKTVSDSNWLARDIRGSIDVLHELYRRLGWRWGVALCDLRK